MTSERFDVMLKYALILSVLLSGCGRISPLDPPSSDEARDSVYKAEVRMTLDLSPFFAKMEEIRVKERQRQCDAAAKDGKKDKLDEECRCEALARDGKKDKSCEKKDGSKKDKESVRSMIRLSKAQEAMGVKVIKTSDDDIEIGWSGTAWTVDRRNGSTYLMTAGHVCESRDVYTLWFFDWYTWSVQTVDLPILAKSHDLIARDNVRAPATVLGDEDLNDETFEGIDLCLLGVRGDFGAPLPIADSDPSYGSHAEVIGAPDGLWGGGVAVTADLKFSGRGNVWGGRVAEGLAFTGDIMGGNSGSPIVKDGRVIALLNLAGTEFEHLTTGVPWEEIRAFFRRHAHRPLGG